MSLTEWKVENGSQIQEAAVSRRFLTDTSYSTHMKREYTAGSWD